MQSCMGGEDGAVIGGESGKKFELMAAAAEAASSMIASALSMNVDCCCEVFIGER